MSLILEVEGTMAFVKRENGELLATLHKPQSTGVLDWWRSPLSGMQFEDPDGSGQQWHFRGDAFEVVSPPEVVDGGG